MKANFTILLAFFSLGIFAQEAGKVGELIKNEAKTSEMQTEQANRRPNSQGAQTANGERPKSNRQFRKITRTIVGISTTETLKYS